MGFLVPQPRLSLPAAGKDGIRVDKEHKHWNARTVNLHNM
jgi:hypothetical protein